MHRQLPHLDSGNRRYHQASNPHYFIPSEISVSYDVCICKLGLLGNILRIQDNRCKVSLGYSIEFQFSLVTERVQFTFKRFKWQSFRLPRSLFEGIGRATSIKKLSIWQIYSTKDPLYFLGDRIGCVGEDVRSIHGCLWSLLF